MVRFHYLRVKVFVFAEYMNCGLKESWWDSIFGAVGEIMGF